MATERLPNPFTVQSPEKLPAGDAVDLFVDVFTDFYKIQDAGHAFLNGPRGSGKSMMFRFLRPDCQCLAFHRKMHEIAFFSVYIPLKNTSLKISELDRLDQHHGAAYLNEHLMTLFFAVEAMTAVIEGTQLADVSLDDDPAVRDAFMAGVSRLLALGGIKATLTAAAPTDTRTSLKLVEDELRSLYGEALQFVRRLSFPREPVSYQGPLLGYIDFLYPLLQLLRAFPFMPKAPIYLLVDDADNLSLTQTRVLNSWVSSRTSAEVSIKISTQFGYKTLRTTTGAVIEAIHDYAEVDISDVYTSCKGKYLDRVREIVKKRLQKYRVRTAVGQTPSPEEFFPPYEKQERDIELIKQQLKTEFAEGRGRGYRASDDVVRYARPMYMKSLAGDRKSSSKYMYAGFEQLVHVSSGIVRYFLGPAANMFSEVQATNGGAPVTQIPPGVQDEVIRADSYNFRFSELEKLRDDQMADLEHIAAVTKLANLVEVLGAVFRKCLLTEGRAERRVFSIALYDEPDAELKEVLQLGVRYGYFHQSTIGKKDGNGRTRLYILSRRLAPTFNLDPHGFAGYLWLSGATLKDAIYRPNALLNRVRKSGIDELADVHQLTLFE